MDFSVRSDSGMGCLQVDSDTDCAAEDSGMEYFGKADFAEAAAAADWCIVVCTDSESDFHKQVAAGREGK